MRAAVMESKRCHGTVFELSKRRGFVGILFAHSSTPILLLFPPLPARLGHLWEQPLSRVTTPPLSLRHKHDTRLSAATMAHTLILKTLCFFQHLLSHHSHRATSNKSNVNFSSFGQNTCSTGLCGHVLIDHAIRFDANNIKEDKERRN